MKRYTADLYDILIPLAEAYESKSEMSVDEYINTVTAVYDEQNSISTTMLLKRESKELLKILIEYPKVLSELKTNALGRDIVEIVAADSAKIEKFKACAKLFNDGELEVKIPDRLKN